MEADVIVANGNIDTLGSKTEKASQQVGRESSVQRPRLTPSRVKTGVSAKVGHGEGTSASGQEIVNGGENVASEQEKKVKEPKKFRGLLRRLRLPGRREGNEQKGAEAKHEKSASDKINLETKPSEEIMDSVLQSMEKVLFSESKSDMKGMLRRLSIPTGRGEMSDLPKFPYPIVGKQPSSTPATPSSISSSLSRPAKSRPPFFNRAALKTRLRPLVAAALSSQQSATISLDSKVDMLRKLLAEQTPPHIRTHLMSKQFAEHARTLFLQQQSLSTTRTSTTTPPATTTVSSTTAIPTSSPIPHTTITTIKSTILRQLLPSAKPSSSSTAAVPTAVHVSSSNELQSLLKIRPVESSMAAAPPRIKILQRKLSVDSDINDSEGFTPTTSTTATTLISATSSASLDIK